MEITQRFFDLLQAPELAPGDAEALGRMLADHKTIQSDVIGKSVELLMHSALTQVTDLQARRLAAVVGGITTGYFKQLRNNILSEQEEILEAYVAAYKAMQQQVSLSAERYRTLVESASQAIFVLDHHGTIRFLNGSGAVQLGGQPVDFMGKTLYQLFPSTQAESLIHSLSAHIEAGVPSMAEAEIPIGNRMEWFEVSLQPLKNQAGEYKTILGIAANITERKAAEAALKRSEERLKVLRQLDKAILASQSMEEITRSALEQLQALLPYWGAMVVFMDRTGVQSCFTAGTAKPYLTINPEQLQRWNSVPAMTEGATLIIEDAQEQLASLLLLQDLALEDRTALLTPLIARNRIIGILTLISNSAEHYNADDVEIAQEIAAILAISVQNAHLLESRRVAQEENERLAAKLQSYAAELERLVHERTQELLTLYDVTAIASEYLDLNTILEKTLNRTLRALSRQAGTLQLLGQSNQEWELVAHAGLDKGQAHLLNSILAKACSNHPAIGERKPLVISGEELTALKQDYSALACYQSIVCTPVKSRGRILGILSIFNEEIGQFSSDEMTLLSSITDHMGVAVENAHLRNQAALIAVGEEQKRLARELHDSVTQSLYSLTLFAEAAQENEKANKLGMVRAQLEDISTTSRQALKEMRLLLYELRAHGPEPKGLVEALRHRLDAVELRSGMSTRLHANVSPDIPEPIANELFHIAVEALNNTLKHAEAKSVEIMIKEVGTSLLMEIRDNGRSFDLAATEQRGGLGLRSMRERTEKLKGQLEIETAPGVGTCIRVNAPSSCNSPSMPNGYASKAEK